MLKSRSELETYLQKEILRFIYDNDKCKEICDYAKDNYNIPRSITSDFISIRKTLDNASEFILFCLLDTIEKITKKKSTEQDKFFTMTEVKTYQVSKYEIDSLKFPLRFNVIKISEDQWIGSIDIKTMMKLRESQLINYNVNAQRTMQKIIKGDKETYKISLNQKAVNEIADLFRRGIYIATPFTLNIQQDANSDFYYDDRLNELVIKSIESLDITDGFHRLIAASKVYDEDTNWNYSMELRITNWTDDKAKQFIFQEDQKTKMKKTDSNSLNMNKAANIVVTRINESPSCNLQGLISRNEGLINFGDLAELIHYFYFKDIIGKEKEKSQIISVTKELIDNFNMLTEYDMKYLETSYSYKKLVTVLCVFHYYNSHNMSKQNMCEIMNSVVEKIELLDNKKFYSKIPKKSMMNEIENIIDIERNK